MEKKAYVSRQDVKWTRSQIHVAERHDEPIEYFLKIFHEASTNQPVLFRDIYLPRKFSPGVRKKAQLKSSLSVFVTAYTQHGQYIKAKGQQAEPSGLLEGNTWGFG